MRRFAGSSLPLWARGVMWSSVALILCGNASDGSTLVPADPAYPFVARPHRIEVLPVCPLPPGISIVVRAPRRAEALLAVAGLEGPAAVGAQAMPGRGRADAVVLIVGTAQRSSVYRSGASVADALGEALSGSGASDPPARPARQRALGE